MTGEMALPGTHDFVMGLVSECVRPEKGARVLDVGAGKGWLSARLAGAGFSVSACDLNPRSFEALGVECLTCDVTAGLPYPDGEFDLVVAVEAVEHIDGHDLFFSEVARVLRPGGSLLFTTPNILLLKSRFLFLLTGCFYSFPPLEPGTSDPVGQHASPFTLNRYEWLLRATVRRYAK